MALARFDEGLDLARDPNLLQHVVPSVVAKRADTLASRPIPGFFRSRPADRQR
jgi:hypothetical protein